jgi:hypothetical protein
VLRQGGSGLFEPPAVFGRELVVLPTSPASDTAKSYAVRTSNAAGIPDPAPRSRIIARPAVAVVVVPERGEGLMCVLLISLM